MEPQRTLATSAISRSMRIPRPAAAPSRTRPRPGHDDLPDVHRRRRLPGERDPLPPRLLRGEFEMRTSSIAHERTGGAPRPDRCASLLGFLACGDSGNPQPNPGFTTSTGPGGGGPATTSGSGSGTAGGGQGGIRAARAATRRRLAGHRRQRRRQLRPARTVVTTARPTRPISFSTTARPRNAPRSTTPRACRFTTGAICRRSRESVNPNARRNHLSATIALTATLAAASSRAAQPAPGGDDVEVNAKPAQPSPPRPPPAPAAPPPPSRPRIPLIPSAGITAARARGPRHSRSRTRRSGAP